MKKVIFLVIVVGLLIIINNQARSIYNLWQKKDSVFNAQKELEYLRLENKKLKSELSYAKTYEFIEKEARNKLFWVKEGEEQILIPEEVLEKKSSEEKEREIKPEKPNWQQWWELFF